MRTKVTIEIDDFLGAGESVVLSSAFDSTIKPEDALMSPVADCLNGLAGFGRHELAISEGSLMFQALDDGQMGRALVSLFVARMAFGCV